MGLADIEITDMKDGTFALESGGQPFAFCDDKEHAETIKKALERCEHDLTAFACVVDTADHRDIMKAVARRKAWDCEPDESDSCELGGMMAEICRGWMERVEADERASRREGSAFHAGKFYRDARGKLCGPLIETGDAEWPLADPGGQSYSFDGKVRVAPGQTGGDLFAGEVPVWSPPKSLPKGLYKVAGDIITGGRFGMSLVAASHWFADWTDPPRPGKYCVPGNGHPAIWECDL